MLFRDYAYLNGQKVSFSRQLRKANVTGANKAYLLLLNTARKFNRALSAAYGWFASPEAS